MIRGTFLIICVLIISGCNNENNIEYFTAEKASYYFKEVEKICNSDEGVLWGENLYGPIIIVDRTTRKLYSNVQDADGLLKPKDGIFIGTYPKEQVISNLAVTYGNTLFSMARLPQTENEYRIKTRCIHGLFHCYQINKGIDNPDYNTNHLDEKTARLWLKMEWKALEKAIRTSGEDRQQAVRDALVFRTARREIFPSAILEENKFENHEGLASFTYLLLCNDNHSDFTKAILESLHRNYDFRSVARSYGFFHGSLYAYLLHEKGFDFSQIESRDFDLGSFAKETYNITLPDICRDVAGSLAINYDIDRVKVEEREREEDLKKDLRKRISQYTERPVVFLELESPNFSFEPDDVDPVDSLGVVYESLSVTDNWGKLAVDFGGCLVSSNLKFMRVPAKNVETDRNHITGDGWHIYLNDTWEMVSRDENYFIRKLIP
jgi:hypothetical protein